MARRSYHQYCAVARGLDVIGDRWLLLIARDLLLGPKRYKDLLSGLPGIGTNLLAARLRDMEEAGLVERTVLPPPAGSPAYRLTGAGLDLEPVITAIGRWGARFLGAPGQGEALLPRAYFVAMRSAFRPGAADVTYEVRVGGLVFEVRLADGRCSIREGGAVRPDAVLAMDVTTLHALLLEGLPAASALTGGRVQVTGDPEHLARFAETFALHGGAPPPGAAH